MNMVMLQLWPGLVMFLGMAHALGDPIVETENGIIRGRVEEFSKKNLRQTGLVEVYLGIPYGKPPIEERRFRPAEPVEPWTGDLNATRTPPSCPQNIPAFYEHLVDDAAGFSEDCLYLNVFVPHNINPNAPVMVFIHGGGYTFGSSSDIEYNPIPLAVLGDVIVVTINYRLSVFGFFTTGDSAIPPNLAVSDQRLALQWVSENIEAFGGDPQKITLFGQGSGAVCVGWHMLTDGSRQFFQRAIMQSGSPLLVQATLPSMDQINERALKLADLANCSPPVPQNTSYIAECLRSKTVEELLDLQEAADALYLGTNIWLPSFDGDFFEQDIPDLLESGAYSDTDLLIGSNEDEGAYVTFRRLGDVTDRPFITESQFNNLTLGETNLLVSGLQKIIYNNGKQDESWNYEEATSDVLGDVTYICNITSFAREVAAAGSKVYMYSMTHQPASSIFNVSWLRAGHAEDIQFVFGLPFFASGSWTYEEVKLSYYVIRMWTNFAKSGNPNTPVGLPRSIPEWPQFFPDSEEYKELDIAFSNSRYLRAPYCEFWDTYVEMIVYLQEHLADVQDGTYSGRG